jgi:hypothetical protein
VFTEVYDKISATGKLKSSFLLVPILSPVMSLRKTALKCVKEVAFTKL